MPSRKSKSKDEEVQEVKGVHLIVQVEDRVEVVFMDIDLYWKFAQPVQHLMTRPANFQEGEPVDG